MKKFIIISILVALFAAGTTLMAQNQQEEYLGLPGDNLNLYAVMKLFQESQTLESFERSLNDENSRINNLDLNGDNIVDYIMVIDYVDGDVHTIVLRVAVNQRENQDVAVFTVQRYSNGQVQIQLTGDESLYGRDYIIEPIYDDGNPGQTPNPGYYGRVSGRNVQSIAAWPLVRFIYLPAYHIWHSSWHWGYYPTYWNPWRPYYYHYYYGYHYSWYNDYYGHYRRWNNHRYSRWNDFYYSSKRSYSPNVSSRIQAGNYRDTYSRPDQRRDGEAMYAKMHPSGTRRPSDNSSGNTIRSGSQSNQARESIGTRNNTTRRSTNTGTNKSVTNSRPDPNVSTTRRSTTTVNNRSVTNSRPEPDVSTTRRSTTTVNKRSVTNSQPEPNVSTTRRTTTTVNNRSGTNSRPEPNVSTTRRSTTTVNNKSVTNSRPEQSAGTNRTYRQPTTGVSSSNRRSSESSKSGTTAKQSGKTKQSESESKKDTRRR
jgi:hypothetical protein